MPSPVERPNMRPLFALITAMMVALIAPVGRADQPPLSVQSAAETAVPGTDLTLRLVKIKEIRFLCPPAAACGMFDWFTVELAITSPGKPPQIFSFCAGCGGAGARLGTGPAVWQIGLEKSAKAWADPNRTAILADYRVLIYLSPPDDPANPAYPFKTNPSVSTPP